MVYLTVSVNFIIHIKEHHAADWWSSEERAAAALWEQSAANPARTVPLQNTRRQYARDKTNSPRCLGGGSGILET